MIFCSMRFQNNSVIILRLPYYRDRKFCNVLEKQIVWQFLEVQVSIQIQWGPCFSIFYALDCTHIQRKKTKIWKQFLTTYRFIFCNAIVLFVNRNPLVLPKCATHIKSIGRYSLFFSVPGQKVKGLRTTLIFPNC